MSRIRTIKPSLFRHEALYEAEKKTGLPLRISYPGLWTVADREGRFKWRPRELKLDCLPYDDLDFEDVLHAFVAYRFIIKYEVDGQLYGCIPTFSKHQVINQRESKLDLPAPDTGKVLHVHADALHMPAHGEGKGKEGKGKEGKGLMVADATAPGPDHRRHQALCVRSSMWQVPLRRST